MILTGRPVAADEAQRIGLADRVVPDGKALSAAVALAKQIAAFPQLCMTSDRMSAYRQWDFDLAAALAHEAHAGAAPLRSEEHTSELQSLMRISYAVFSLKKKNNKYTTD